MNHNLNLKCEVCENIVRLKVYGGYKNENFFSYSCPECSINIDGRLIWNENLEEGFIKEFQCNNATESVKEGKESHILQIATEFYTDKIKRFDPDDISLFFSPFMKDTSSNEMKFKKTSLVKYTTDNFRDEYNNAMRILQLYKNRKFKYLDRQLLLHKYIKPVPLGQLLKIDYQNVITDVVYSPFRIFLGEKGYDKKITSLRYVLNSVKKRNNNETLKLKEEMKELVSSSEEDLVHLLENFYNYHHYIWPVILSTIYKTENIDEIKKNQGILTTNFEALKNYYVESFEVLCNVLPLFLGIQNIKLRNDRNKFSTEMEKNFPKIKTIIDFDEKVSNKGNKIKFFENENIFSDYFDIKSTLNNAIRNSIGHHSYQYESENQLIKFQDRKNSFELYLIEFSELLFETFFATFIAIEIIWFYKDIND